MACHSKLGVKMTKAKDEGGNIDWEVQKPFDLFLNLTDSIKWLAIRSHVGQRMAVPR